MQPLESFDSNFTAILANASKKKTNICTNSHAFTNHTLKLMQKVYALPYSIVYPANMSKNNLSVDDVSQCFNQLEDIKLGQYFTVKANNGKVVNHFIRIDSQSLDNDLSIGQALMDIGCNVNDVKETLLETEEIEAELLGPEILNQAICENTNNDELNETIRNENGKRQRSNDVMSSEIPNKRRRLGENDIIFRRKDNGLVYKYTDQLIKRLRKKRQIKIASPIREIFNPLNVAKTPLAIILDNEEQVQPRNESSPKTFQGNKLMFVDKSPSSQSEESTDENEPNVENNNQVVDETDNEDTDSGTQFDEFAKRFSGNSKSQPRLATNASQEINSNNQAPKKRGRKAAQSNSFQPNHTKATKASSAKEKKKASKTQSTAGKTNEANASKAATQGDEPQSKPVKRRTKK
jgi:hypothetical protein